MRRCLPGNGPRPLRQVDTVRGSAGALRHIARRHQGAQRHTGGEGAGHGHPGRAGQVRAPLGAPLPDDRVLEFQPLRRARGISWQPCLHQRPGPGAAYAHQGRVRRRLLRRLPPLSARPRVSQGRQAAERAAWPVLPAGLRAHAASLRHIGDAGADRSRHRPADASQGLRERRADPAQRRFDDSADDRHGAHCMPASRAHLAPARVPGAHGDQSSPSSPPRDSSCTSSPCR